jgi:hypothetical protein
VGVGVEFPGGAKIDEEVSEIGRSADFFGDEVLPLGLNAKLIKSVSKIMKI